MQVEKINLRSTQSFSDFFLDYVEDKEELRPFYGLRPEINCFEQQIKSKNYDDANRKVLCQVLNKQYSTLDTSNEVEANIASLVQSNTYTLTTGHQLNIFTGPLYFIYKIATVVNACKELKLKYPDQNFVPVYWMASEDHDFDEISYFNLFGKKYEWATDQKGAVGRFSTNGLEGIVDELPEKVEIFEKAYKESNNLADAVRYYVNSLFAEDGVVVLDADDHDLKSLFANVIKDDIINNEANRLVEQANTEIVSAGYKPQIFAREINFFYLQDQSRERIVKDGDAYKINNTELTFSEDGILAELESHPEKFSPNVVMRPLYQEVILPNLAYTGGPAEVVYWMQLKKVFEKYDVAYPILLPRNFALYINAASVKRLNKFDLSSEDIFKSEKELKSEFLAVHAENEVSLNGEVGDLKKVYDILTEKATAIDGSLKGFIASEYAKASKGLENIGKRLKKSEESKHETSLNQLSALKLKLFPGGGLQERHDNFFNFYINNREFVSQVIKGLDAFDMRMHLLSEG